MMDDPHLDIARDIRFVRDIRLDLLEILDWLIRHELYKQIKQPNKFPIFKTNVKINVIQNGPY